MQDVPLYAGAKIRAGAKVVDYALDVTHQPLRADATISFQFDTLVISKAANPDSHTPEGIMWRQPRLILRNATGFTESANSWIVAQPEGILRPNMKTVLGTAPVAGKKSSQFPVSKVASPTVLAKHADDSSCIGDSGGRIDHQCHRRTAQRTQNGKTNVLERVRECNRSNGEDVERTRSQSMVRGCTRPEKARNRDPRDEQNDRLADQQL